MHILLLGDIVYSGMFWFLFSEFSEQYLPQKRTPSPIPGVLYGEVAHEENRVTKSRYYFYRLDHILYKHLTYLVNFYNLLCFTPYEFDFLLSTWTVVWAYK